MSTQTNGNKFSIDRKLSNLEKALQGLTTLLTQKQDVPMSIDDASKFLSLEKSYLYQLCSKNKIPFYKPAGKIYFSKAELTNWIFSKKQKSKQEIQDALNEGINEGNE